eukprot:scaffold41026_cov21-Phaeocystis_antarctica.AAC.1
MAAGPDAPLAARHFDGLDRRGARGERPERGAPPEKIRGDKTNMLSGGVSGRFAPRDDRINR